MSAVVVGLVILAAFCVSFGLTWTVRRYALRSNLLDHPNERSLHEDFTFLPRPEDRTELGDEAFDGWDKSVEMDYVTRLKGIYLGDRLVQFGDERGEFEREDVAVGRAEYEGNYIMTLDVGDGSEPEIYEGRAIFVIVEANQGWMLLSWEDVDVIGTNPTSGYLRGTLRGVE